MINANRIITRTTAEQKMAKALSRAGIKFEQNYLVESYEVDFFIKEGGLAIEIDGFTHLSKEKSTTDQNKDRKLHDKGYTVIRLENNQIHNELELCVKKIKSMINNAKPYFDKQSLENPNWKEALKPIKQKLKKMETKEKSFINIEYYFLSLDQEKD